MQTWSSGTTPIMRRRGGFDRREDAIEGGYGEALEALRAWLEGAGAPGPASEGRPGGDQAGPPGG